MPAGRLTPGPLVDEGDAVPLLDHFRPPLSDRRHGHAFHNSWATYLSSALNARLPAGYFAEANVQYGIGIDVAAVDETGTEAAASSGYVPPDPTDTVPIAASEAVVEVGIFSRSGGPVLAGAVELVSPANKDRPAHRDAFTTKCAAYLHAGVGLVVVDVVTERPADLHGDLLARLGAGRGRAGPGGRRVVRGGVPAGGARRGDGVGHLARPTRGRAAAAEPAVVAPRRAVPAGRIGGDV